MRTIVRVVDNAYVGKKGLVFQRTLQVMKRLSTGHSVIFDDIADSPCDYIPHILNLFDFDEVRDGELYEITYANVSYDIESGYADDWDYILIPYTEE